MVFYALPQFGILLDQFTVAVLTVMIWGGGFNTENFRAGFEAVPFRYREAGAALGFSRLATFVNDPADRDADRAPPPRSTPTSPWSRTRRSCT